MKNVCHPLCACGAPVMVHEWKVPVYDDGGGLDCIDFEYEFDSECGKCYIKHETAYNMNQDCEDDLPF